MKTSNEIGKWLRANCGKRALAPLTSHDWEALLAATAMTPLISFEGANPELFAAYRAVVMEMQPQCRWMAYHTIAMELDWGHRSMIWAAAGLPAENKPKYEASFGPGGRHVDLSKEAA